MKHILFKIGLWSIFFSFAIGCKDDVILPSQPLDQYAKVYMPQAVNNPKLFSFNASDSTTADIIYGADLGGYGYSDKDIDISFGVDSSAIDSFNMANNTKYTLLPAKSYKLSDLSAIVKKGELSTKVCKATISVSGDLAPDDPSLTYILPITINSANANINAKLQTYYCVIKIVPDINTYSFYDRSNWKIAGFSSQEASGEGPNNGRAVFVLDGNPSTYWHTQWQNGQPGPPHYLVIDQGVSTMIHGCGLLGRQDLNNGKPKDIQLFSSDNGIDWTLVSIRTMNNTMGLQKFFLDRFVKARYVKYQVNSSYVDVSYTHLTEFYLF